MFPNGPPPVRRVTLCPVLKAGRTKQMRAPLWKLQRVCPHCKAQFVVPHPSYPANCCSVKCGQRYRRSRQIRIVARCAIPRRRHAEIVRINAEQKDAA